MRMSGTSGEKGGFVPYVGISLASSASMRILAMGG